MSTEADHAAGPGLSAVTIPVMDETGVVAARQAARSLVDALGLDVLESATAAAAATAVAELVRHAGGELTMSVSDDGAGRRITIEAAPPLPLDAGTATVVATLADLGYEGRHTDEGLLLFRSPPLVPTADPLPSRLAPDTDAVRSNEESLVLLLELRRRAEEIRAIASELEDTNRGVLALHQELEQGAATVRHAADIQATFLSHVTHEFRTPLSSIQGLSRLLLDRTDGELTEEQEKQVSLILRSAADLRLLVDDLLDLVRSKTEAAPVRLTTFSLTSLFGGLRAVTRAFERSPQVSLVVEDPRTESEVTTDEGKVNQILRNLISNALKFTERGEVRVSADVDGAGNVVISVSDTGIGIAAEHLPFLFDEFYQVDSPLQRRRKGTGLGLPLSQLLAATLGGAVTVESEPGVGSTFTLALPLVYRGPEKDEEA